MHVVGEREPRGKGKEEETTIKGNECGAINECGRGCIEMRNIERAKEDFRRVRRDRSVPRPVKWKWNKNKKESGGSKSDRRGRVCWLARLRPEFHIFRQRQPAIGWGPHDSGSGMI